VATSTDEDPSEEPKDEPAAEAKDQEKPALVSIEAPKITATVRIARALYWVIWFVSIPLLFAYVVVSSLMVPSGVDQPGVLGWIQSAVREQPVPVGIGCFALMEMALGAVRRRLPLSKWAYPPLREDLPPKLRGLFERAAALLDEAEQIQALNEKAIIRELSSKERTRLRESLEALRLSMRIQQFDEERFVEALAHADGEVDVHLGKWRKSESCELLRLSPIT